MTSLYYVNILDVWYFFESMMTSHYYVNILDVWDFFLINNDVTRIEIKLKNVYAKIWVHQNLILGGNFFRRNFVYIDFSTTFKRSRWRPVWPDVGRKSNPNFETIAPKVSIKALNKKVMFLIIAQKGTKYLGFFWKQKICCKEILKIAESGHTGGGAPIEKLDKLDIVEHSSR